MSSNEFVSLKLLTIRLNAGKITEHVLKREKTNQNRIVITVRKTINRRIFRVKSRDNENKN